MSKWLKRIRGAILMGVTWALLWAPVGVLIGMIVDWDGTLDEPWIIVGALPGFLAGVTFSLVLGIAASRRRLDELSVEKVGGWGAVAGFLIGVLPLVIGDHGPDSPRVIPLDLVIISSITLLSAVSAASSLVLARKSDRRGVAEIGAGAPEFEVAERETEELPGSRR
jgi:hypothetical protein